MTKTVNQAAAELDAEIGAQYPTHPGTNASEPVFQAQLAAATSPAMMIGAQLDQIRARSPPARLLWLCKGLEDLGLDASCLASVREQVETERRLKEAPQIVRTPQSDRQTLCRTRSREDQERVNRSRLVPRRTGDGRRPALPPLSLRRWQPRRA
jgi:hypothetical protein